MTHADSGETRIDWHQHDAGRQAIVSVDSGDIHLTIALPTDVPRSVVDAVLTELDRELAHYCGTNEETDHSAHG